MASHDVDVAGCHGGGVDAEGDQVGDEVRSDLADHECERDCDLSAYRIEGREVEDIPRKTANFVFGSLFSARIASRMPAGVQYASPQILPVQEAAIIPIVAVKLADQGAASN